MPEAKGSDHSALETLRRFYDAESAYMASGGNSGFSAIAATLHNDCVIYQPASLPYGGEWRGHAGFESWMKAFAQQWSALDVKDSKFFPHEDIIFSKSHVYATARATGKAIDWPLLQLIRFRDAKIIELRPFHWDTAAMLPTMTR